VVDGIAVGAALEQRFDQRQVAGRRRGHQRRLVHRQPMLDAVLLALLQDVLEMVGEVGQVGLASEGRALLREVHRLLEFRLRDQPFGELRFVMAGGVFVELLLQLGAGNLFAEHLDQQLDDLRFAEHRPGNRRLLEDRPADRFGLLLLALQFELARFLLPVFEGRLPGVDLDLAEDSGRAGRTADGRCPTRSRRRSGSRASAPRRGH
jgi:hypothetical protein